MLRKAVDVRHRGSAPAIDGLQRIAHGRERVALAVQVLQHQPLRHRGVLVLVHEHNGVALPHLLANRRGLGDQDRQAHEIGETHHPLRRPVCADLLDDVRDENAPARGHDRVPGIGAGLGLQGFDETCIVRAEILRGDQMFGQFLIQRLHTLADRTDGRGPQVLTTHMAAGDRAIGVDRKIRRREQSRRGFPADQQRPLGQQVHGEGVVGGNGRLGDVILAGLTQKCQQRADPAREFPGRLVREREAQDLIRGDQAGGHQPYDPRRHHRGLAGPCTGQHEHRTIQRRTDGGPLLVARGESQQAGQLLAVHGRTSAPCGSAGHELATTHVRHPLPGRATASSARMPAATDSRTGPSHSGTSGVS